MTKDELFMKEAVALSATAVEHGNEPFGAVLVKDGEIVYTNENQIYSLNDPTFHAEFGLIRRFCAETGITDLREYTLYSSCEPCPMCLSAIIWSNIKKVYYGNTKEDAADIGFRDEFIYEYLEKISNDKEDKKVLKLKELNRDEAIEVFERYEEDKDKIVY